MKSSELNKTIKNIAEEQNIAIFQVFGTSIKMPEIRPLIINPKFMGKACSDDKMKIKEYQLLRIMELSYTSFMEKIDSAQIKGRKVIDMCYLFSSLVPVGQIQLEHIKIVILMFKTAEGEKFLVGIKGKGKRETVSALITAFSSGREILLICEESEKIRKIRRYLLSKAGVENIELSLTVNCSR